MGREKKYHRRSCIYVVASTYDTYYVELVDPRDALTNSCIPAFLSVCTSLHLVSYVQYITNLDQTKTGALAHW